jgi:hypothetical protein
MTTVRLVCWNQELAQERARLLKKAGIAVDASPLNPGALIGYFRENQASAVLIDLDRLPSHGREVATALRNNKVTRLIPIVFAGGVEEKVERIRRELPDAVFTGWSKAAQAVRKALKNAPANPVQPLPHMQRYAASPLEKKLGVKPEMKVALLAAPEEFELDGQFQNRITGETKLILWFVRSRQELDAAAEHAGVRMPDGGSVWIIYPKQSSRYRVDFKQNDVLAAGLAAGLVDYKVCAVDADWTGLKFARKKTTAPANARRSR